jgi:MinD-like ATPase involved in chromosome partitioning or flagellar assembly
MSGRIVTFYSYKGGVGRTFALANVGAILAQWGARVLVVDWDIEAPGLTHYFAGLESSRGVLDFLQDCMQESVVGHEGYKSAYRLPSGGSIDVMPALGKQSTDYARIVQSLGWDELYDTHALGAHLEELRKQWTSAYDLVLIDSRTGITDFSGVTTAQLPDILVFLFTANAQSLDGCVDVARRAMEARRQLPVDRAALLPLPVPARFDQREEYERALLWRTRFVNALAPFVDLWKPTYADTSKLLDHLTIPYQARWTFGEDLAVEEEIAGPSGVRSPSQVVTYALETLAAVLVHGLAKADLLVSSRDEYVHSARSVVRSWHSRDRVRPKVFISGAVTDGTLVNQVASVLRDAHFDFSLYAPATGPSGISSAQELTSGQLSVISLANTIEDADAYVVLLAEDSKSQELEIEAILRQRLRSQKQKPVIPLVLTGREGALARSRLSDFVAVPLQDAAPSTVLGTMQRVLARLEPVHEAMAASGAADGTSSGKTDNEASMAAGAYGSVPIRAQSTSTEVPTLLVQTTYFSEDDRESAEALGYELYELLTRSRTHRLAFGPGIPVRIAVHPEELALDVAKHVVVIPVVGQRTFLEARNAALATLRAWHDQLAQGGAVVPVLMSRVWRAVVPDLPGRAVLHDIDDKAGARFSRTTTQIVLSTCRLLCGPNGRLQVFISHDKGDLASAEHAAQTLREFARNSTLDVDLYDTVDLHPGVELKDRLQSAARHGVFVTVRSDGYAAQPWCQRELLWAKQAAMPMLTVEVLRQGEPRSYPYGGNGPTIVWSERPDYSKPASGGTDNALRVIQRATVEWLRAQHFQCEAPRFTVRLPEFVVLPRPPELLDLAQGPLLATRSPVVLHPDPELSLAEREVLRLSRPRLQLVTPTTLYRSIGVSKRDDTPRPAALQGVRVAISASEVIDDAQMRKGTRREHAQDALVHITRSMVSAGAAIAYGGDLRIGGYDEIFLDLIHSYNKAGVREADLLHSYIPATFNWSTVSTSRAFKIEAVGNSARRLLPSPAGELSRARSALYLSEMRRIMSLECQARMLLAGQALPMKNGGMVGYSGPYPGLVEEAWHTLCPAEGTPRPLYVVGGFGGAAALVSALASDEPSTPLLEARNFSGAEYSQYRSIVAEFESDPDRQKIGIPATPDALASEVRQKLRSLLESDASSVAWNGLTIAENRELFGSQDVVRLTALILEGLFKVRARQLENLLEIELVAGHILRTERADAIVLPVFQDVPIAGVGLALDKATGGAVSAAHDRGLHMVALTSPQVDANWLVFANLGPLREKERLPDIIQAEAARVSQLALRNDFGRISLVTFAGSVHGNVEVLAERMLAGFASLPDRTQIQWFEANPGRFERLEKYLRARKGVALSHRVVPELDSEPSPNEDLFAIVRKSGDQVRCTLFMPGGGAASHEHTSVLPNEGLQTLNRASSPRTPPLDAIEEIGRNVARLLFGHEGMKQLEHYVSERRLVIQHDLESSAIPFETLRVGATVPAVNKGLVRRLSLRAKQPVTPPQRPPTTGKLRLMLVVNPTSDLYGTKMEADEITLNLANAAQVEIQRLEGPMATKQAVTKALADESIDVLHYSGHAAFETLGEDGSGIVCADGPLTLRNLLRKPMGPRIVFFNADQSARVGNGEATTLLEAQSFAEAVLRSGADAYLGTFWPVADKAAASFAATVYRELAEGAELHAAVTAARRMLFDARQPDWANYLLFGNAAFKLKTGWRT